MNIFDGILSNENNTTEVLKNLLRYKLFRAEFLNFLGVDKDIAHKNFYTQVQLEEKSQKYGIIDLYIEDDEKKYLIEIKTNYYTSLSKKQTDDRYQEYLNILPQKSNGELFYLIPKNYHHKEKIKGNIKYWEDFLTRIKKVELDKLNPFIGDFTEFFYNYWAIDLSYKFSKRELQIIFRGETMLADASIPKIMRKLEHIVEDVIGEDIKIIRKNKSDTEQNPDQYGYHIKSNIGDIYIWFGIDFDIWEEKGYPLTVWIDSEDEEILEEIIALLKDSEFEEYSYEVDEEKYKSAVYGFTEKDFSSSDGFKVETYRNKILETIDKLQNLDKS